MQSLLSWIEECPLLAAGRAVLHVHPPQTALRPLQIQALLQHPQAVQRTLLLVLPLCGLAPWAGSWLLMAQSPQQEALPLAHQVVPPELLAAACWVCSGAGHRQLPPAQGHALQQGPRATPAQRTPG